MKIYQTKFFKSTIAHENNFHPATVTADHNQHTPTTLEEDPQIHKTLKFFH